MKPIISRRVVIISGAPGAGKTTLADPLAEALGFALISKDQIMDGNLFSREWSEERIRDSQSLFERRGVGIWLAYHKTADELVGFCGFLEFPSMRPEPQLIYAMFGRFSGRGYATEMASTMIALARNQAGFAQIVAGVDEVNIASLRVLEKLGFKRIATMQASFGNMFLLQF